MKNFQTTIDELQGKYVTLVNGNAIGGYFTVSIKFGKFWPELKSLFASHTTLNEAFHNTKLLQNPLSLEILDMKKGVTLKEDKLIELTTLLSTEVSNLQGITQTLEQRLKLMEQRRKIHEKTFTPATMHMIGILHIHLNELDSRISNFESSMTIARYPDTSHMSKLERDIIVLQDNLETHQKEATTWTSKL